MTKREMEAKNERAQFEAWLQPSMPRDGQIDEDGDFFYRDDWVQGAWIAWRHLAQQAGADDEMRQVCAEAYQVVGWLLSDIGAFDSEAGQKILDNLSEQRLVHADVLPWASPTPQPAIPAAEIFAAGWHLACDWAGREDLHRAEGSRAYKTDRAARLAALVQSDKDRAR